MTKNRRKGDITKGNGTPVQELDPLNLGQDQPVVSVVMVNYNSGEFVLSCLRAIQKGFQGLAREVVVVDNCSQDSSCSQIRSEFPGFILIENPYNLGFARAINQGFRRTRGRYLLILNPDVTLVPGSVEKAIDFLEKHPEVGLLLPKLVNPDGTLQFSCRTFYDLSTLLFRRTPLGQIFPAHRVIRQHLMMDWDHDEVRDVDWGLGACMFLRREALKGGNLFDERFFLYFEDVDLCWRLKNEGWKVVYYPKAVMIHAHLRQSADGFFNRAKWEHFKSLIKFYLKHRRFSPQHQPRKG